MTSGSSFGSMSPQQNTGIEQGKRFALFATDSTQAAFEQVWVTVYEVALVRGGSATAVYQDDQGRRIDLRAFDGKAAQAVFLGEGALGAGDFDSFRVVLGDKVETFAKGSAVPKEYSLTGARSDKATVQAPLSNRRKLRGGSDDLVVDLNSAKWDWTGQSVKPVVQEGAELKLEETQGQLDADFVGQVRDVAENGPTRSLSLLDRGGRTVRVLLDEDAVVVRPDGSASTLERDAFVVVRGPFDMRARAIRSHTVIALPERKAGDVAHGLASMAKEGEFTLKVQQARGFTPDRVTMRVLVDEQTKFVGDRGATLSAEQFNQRVQAQKLVAVSLDGELAPVDGVVKARLVRVGR